MTTNIILLGGNGYIGQALTETWQQADSEAEIWSLSRSGKNKLTSPRLHSIPVDLTQLAAVEAVLPPSIDYVVDLVGGPEKDAGASRLLNDVPAEVMQTLAERYQVKAMGFIGGKLGPKAFVQTKMRLINQLSESTIPLAYVEPTLVYGNGRSDTMTKLVPFLKIVGSVMPSVKPVRVDEVVATLYRNLLRAGKSGRTTSEN